MCIVTRSGGLTTSDDSACKFDRETAKYEKQEIGRRNSWVTDYALRFQRQPPRAVRPKRSTISVSPFVP